MPNANGTNSEKPGTFYKPIDFKRLSSDLLGRAEQICEMLFPAGERRGHEYVVGNIAGDAGDSLSINLKTGVWSDFSCDHGGSDLISLAAAHWHCGQLEAAKRLSKDINEYRVHDGYRMKTNQEIFEPILPAPKEIKNFRIFNSSKFGEPAAVYVYRDRQGQVNNYVIRFEPTGQRKQFHAVTFGTLTNEKGTVKKWHWKQIPNNRPLYGLELISAPKNKCIIVEGEKAAEALRTIYPNAPIFTWPGGTKAVSKADFSPLYDYKSVILWPDNDEGGIQAMNTVGQIISHKVPQIGILNTSSLGHKEDASDLVERGLSRKEISKFIADNCTAWELVAHMQPVRDEPPSSENIEPQPYPARLNRQLGLIALGYNNDQFFVYPLTSKQVRILTPSKLNANHLLSLAPLEWWRGKFPNKYGIDWQTAANWLMQSCYNEGVYEQDKVRGRGAWHDNGRIVLHLGDKLLVDGEVVELNDIPTRYFYTAAQRFNFTPLAPLNDNEAYSFFDLCTALTWENSLSGILLAGWCALAVVCGALAWRPHIWLTGPASAGKSWILREVIHKIIGNFALTAVHESTEAGIRSDLGYDARPVIFDEIKGEDKRDVEKIQSLMGLIRQSSTETGAPIIKGTASGGTNKYLIRSSFVLASIGYGVRQHADETRICELRLKSPSKNRITRGIENKRIDEITHKAKIVTEEYASKFTMRIIKQLPITQKNINVFVAAVTKCLGNKRAGDQVGTLLAGAYSLISSKEITSQEADKLVGEWNIVSLKQESEEDCTRCLNHILEYPMKVKSIRSEILSTNIAELIMALQTKVFTNFDELTARRELRVKGIQVDSDGVIALANSHTGIREILQNTGLVDAWTSILKQHKNYISSKINNGRYEQMRFGNLSTRVTRLDIKLGDDLGNSAMKQNEAWLLAEHTEL